MMTFGSLINQYFMGVYNEGKIKIHRQQYTYYTFICFFVGVISSIGMIVIEDSLEHVALISGIAQALYLLLVIFIFALKKVDILNTYGLKAVPLKEYLLPVIVAFCFSAFSNIVQAAAPIPQELTGGMSDDMEKNITAFILSIFIVAPIVEEFVFRALIMTKLRKEVPTVISIIISAILFALIHFMAGGIITVVHAFFGGLIFALVYVKTKSLFPAITAHIFGNIGGCVPTVTNRLSVTIQYIIAVSFLIATIVFCVILIRKKEDYSKRIKYMR